MEIKQEVLRILEENRGNVVNGAQLARELSVSRSSIWKAVKSLEKEGYEIHAVTNKGYCLLENNDIISRESLKPYLKGRAKNFEFQLYEKVTSTNTIAKEMAGKGAKEGTVIVAEEQTEGRGRMGRNFYSPSGSGLYFSLILRPKLNMEEALLITTSTAVALCKAIETIAKVKAKIKWVNDIYVEDKKICGILTEASLNFESGSLEYAVVGIGINIHTQDFPEDIKSVAGSVFPSKPENIPIKTLLLAEILNELSKTMDTFTDKSYLQEYRDRSMLIGKEIYVYKGSQVLTAQALDIDERARLVVQYKDQTREALNSGEVSTKAMTWE